MDEQRQPYRVPGRLQRWAGSDLTMSVQKCGGTEKKTANSLRNPAKCRLEVPLERFPGGRYSLLGAEKVNLYHRTIFPDILPEALALARQSEAANFTPLMAGAHLVELPHRQLLTNTALWYALRLAPGQAGYLQLDADDGLQLWQDTERRLPLASGLYPLAATTDSSWLYLRVLNNAAAFLYHPPQAGRSSPFPTRQHSH